MRIYAVHAQNSRKPDNQLRNCYLPHPISADTYSDPFKRLRFLQSILCGNLSSEAVPAFGSAGWKHVVVVGGDGRWEVICQEESSRRLSFPDALGVHLVSAVPITCYIHFPTSTMTRSPQPSSDSRPFSFALKDVDAISDPLRVGTPWEALKEIDFCSCPE